MGLPVLVFGGEANGKLIYVPVIIVKLIHTNRHCQIPSDSPANFFPVKLTGLTIQPVELCSETGFDDCLSTKTLHES